LIKFSVGNICYDGGGQLEGELGTLHRKTHQTIKKVTEDIEQRFHFNTAISAVMELVNVIYQFRSHDRKSPEALSVLRSAVETALVLISPMVPHIADEMWEALGHEKSVIREGWPQWNDEAIIEEQQLIVVQINGKLRNRIHVAPSATKEEVQEAALADERIKRFLGDKPIRKVVVVPGRLVNVVV